MERPTAHSNWWNCPNDRHLQLRAQLGTGWSYRSNRVSTSNDRPTHEEIEKILSVIRRNDMINEMEMQRIGSLVGRLNNMQQMAFRTPSSINEDHSLSSNNSSACYLCGQEYKMFSLCNIVPCTDCNQFVCDHCCIDVRRSLSTFHDLTDSSPATSPFSSSSLGKALASPHRLLLKDKQMKHLCKLCVEKRELWKRSGAWFYKKIPPHALPSRNELQDSCPLCQPQISSISMTNACCELNSSKGSFSESLVKTSHPLMSTPSKEHSVSPQQRLFRARAIKRHPMGMRAMSAVATSDSENDKSQDNELSTTSIANNFRSFSRVGAAGNMGGGPGDFQ